MYLPAKVKMRQTAYEKLQKVLVDERLSEEHKHLMNRWYGHLRTYLQIEKILERAYTIREFGLFVNKPFTIIKDFDNLLENKQLGEGLVFFIENFRERLKKIKNNEKISFYDIFFEMVESLGFNYTFPNTEETYKNKMYEISWLYLVLTRGDIFEEWKN